MATTILSACVLAFVVAPARSGTRDWPPFLPAADEYPGQIARAITRLWHAPTFSRKVRGDVAPVPLGFYLRFVDAPDLTAAASRHLHLAGYEVVVLGDDWYKADDHDGAHGVYRVLLRDHGRRVVLSWGTHRGPLLGPIAGSALTRLDFSEAPDGTAQRLAVNVIIDNAVAAGLTRTMLPLFGWFVDRKLAEGFRTTARVARWAHEQPEDFCAWFAGALDAARRRELTEVVSECADAVALRPRASSARTDDRASGRSGAETPPRAP